MEGGDEEWRLDGLVAATTPPHRMKDLDGGVITYHPLPTIASLSEPFQYHNPSNNKKLVLEVGVVWCGVVGCGVVWCGVVWCGVVLCGVVWCGVVGVVWCGVVWCGVVVMH